jgi:hypothetical protein
LSGSSKYPGALDAIPSDKGNSTNSREGKPKDGPAGDHPEHHNLLADGVNTTQEILGLNPQGERPTVADRFEVVEDAIEAGLGELPENLATLDEGGKLEPAQLPVSVESRSSFPALVNPTGISRWLTALASAGAADAPIFYIGDSHTYGEYWNGTELKEDDATCSVNSPAARLRELFAATYGDPGEGFWFPNDGRITAGGGIVTGIATGPAVQRNNARFTKEGHTLTVTIPAGKAITRLSFLCANRETETATVTATKNGTPTTSITSTGTPATPTRQDYSCTEGDVFVFTGPAAGALTCLGFVLRTAQTHGVPVHRMGRRGYTVPNVIGGVYNGLLGAAENGTIILTAEQIQREIRACYRWSGAASFLVILQYGTNENTKQFQASGIDCGVTPGLFRSALSTIIQQVNTDGGDVLLAGPCPAPTEITAGAASPLSAYTTMAYSLAVDSAHCSMLDIASNAAWGGGFSGLDGAQRPIEVTDAEKATAVAAAATAGLRDPSSSHPTPLGYESYADIIYSEVH